MERCNCERLCHRERDLASLVALSVFCSFCLCVFEVECVCTACINSMCTAHYIHNMIRGFPCFVCGAVSCQRCYDKLQYKRDQ